MEDIQPKRYIPKAVNKEQGLIKEPAPKQAGKAHNSTGHKTEKKENKRKQTTPSRRREKSQSTRGLSSDPEQEEESDPNNSGSDEGDEVAYLG
ncbi:unnamed protein product [Rhizoctonia solani]